MPLCCSTPSKWFPQILIGLSRATTILRTTFLNSLDMEALLGVDLGTTNCKAIVYDLNGNRIADSQVEYPTYHPRPLWAEQDPKDWLDAFFLSARAAIREAYRKGYRIIGMTLTGQREGVVPISKNGEPLDRCIIWMDERSIPQTEEIRSTISEEEIYEKTGLRLAPMFTATKLIWLKENKPEVYEKAHVFLQPKEFINFILTGKACTDPSLASRTLLFNIHKLDWDTEIISSCELSVDKLPEIIPSHEIIGHVREDYVKKLGLRRSIPVINGGGDRPCEALGAGVIRHGIVGETTGTTTNIKMSIDEVVLDPKRRILCSCHVIDDLRLLEAGTTPTGAILRWFRDNIALKEVEEAMKKGIDPYDIISKEAEKVNPGSNGLILLPFFMGANAPRWNPYLRGAILGLTLGHTRAHIARCIMESVAYLCKEIFDVFGELNLEIDKVVLLGGAARSTLWGIIKASVWRRRVIIPREIDAAPLGAAILAGLGTGAFNSAEEAVKDMIAYISHHDPIERWSKLYEKFYNAYLKITNTLENVFTEVYREEI